VKATFIAGEVEAFLVVDAEAAALLASVVGDALRRGLQLDADAHLVVDRLDQLGRVSALTSTVSVGEVDTGASCDGAHVTPDAAGRRLGVSGHRVRQLVAQGQLKAERYGRLWRIPITAVEQLAKEREQRCQPSRNK
jgi:excisionase family DNA binding protein